MRTAHDRRRTQRLLGSEILALFGINLGGPAEVGSDLLYRLRDDFLSAAELGKRLTNSIRDQVDGRAWGGRH